LLDEYRHIELATTPSTNMECIERAKLGDPGKLWITAKTQSEGRGSRGRSWQSDEGNLSASLLLLNPAAGNSAAVLSGLTFVSSLALLRAIKEWAPEANVKLKWPNDVLVSGKKCAGILLENQSINGNTVVIIGIGVNCTSHPSETNYPATDLGNEGIITTAEHLFAELAKHMDEFLAEWDEGRNFAGIRETWLKHASGIGEPIVVRIPGRPDENGIFETIDEAGFLILRQENNTQKRISAADIFI